MHGIKLYLFSLTSVYKAAANGAESQYFSLAAQVILLWKLCIGVGSNRSACVTTPTGGSKMEVKSGAKSETPPRHSSKVPRWLAACDCDDVKDSLSSTVSRRCKSPWSLYVSAKQARMKGPTGDAHYAANR